MTEVRKPGTGRIDEAAARRAADEAARAAAARAAAQAQAAARARAAAEAQAAAQARAAAARDANGVSAANAPTGPTGARALPALPVPPAGFEGFAGFNGPNAELKGLAARVRANEPGAREQLQAALRTRVDAIVKGSLAGKAGKEGVDAAMKALREEVRGIARDTGVSEDLQAAVQSGLEANKGLIAETAEKGRAWWQKAGDLLGDVVGGLADVAGDIVKDVADVAGDAVHAVTGLAADAVRGVADAAGEVANAAIDGAGAVVASGLDAVGAEGLAQGVRTASDALGDAQRAVLQAEGKIVGGALDIAGTLVDKTLDFAGGAVDGVLDVAGAVAADGPLGAAAGLADRAIGPEVPEFAGEIDGLTGTITNRLERGGSVFVRGEAGAEVGVGVFAGGKLTGGAVLGRSDDGQITLALEVGAEGEVGLKTGVGGHIGGVVEAEAGAQASVAGGAEGKITLKFDPANPADVARLQALLEPSPAKLAVAAVNPLAAASLGGPALADAMRHNLESTEVGGSVGLRGSAKAGAELGPVAAEVGIEASALAGGSRKFNRDGSTETTLFVKAEAEASASATAEALAGMGVEAKAEAAGLIAIKVTRDKDGNITGIAGERTGKLETDAGIKDDASVSHGHGEAESSLDGEKSKTVTVERELTEAGMAEARRRIAAGQSVLSVYNDLRSRPGMYTEVRTTSSTRSITVGFEAEVKLGAVIGVDLQATLGRTRTSTERRGGPSSTHVDMATDGPVGGLTGG